MINRGRFSLFAKGGPEYSVRAVDLVQRSTVIDMLGLLTLDYRKMSAWQAQPERFQQADFQRLKDSGITVFYPAVGYTAGDIYTEIVAGHHRLERLHGRASAGVPAH